VPASGGSTTIPAGTNAQLIDKFRFKTLRNPLSLPPTNYVIVAYQLDGEGANGLYSFQNWTNNWFNGDSCASSSSSVFQLTGLGSPDYPTGTGSENFGSTPFIYYLSATSSVVIVAQTPNAGYINVGDSVNLTANSLLTPASYQ